jgi:hypothetical protein
VGARDTTAEGGGGGGGAAPDGDGGVPQVRKAQKAIPTGLVYRQNEVTLAKIGAERLQVMRRVGRVSQGCALMMSRFGR